MHGMSEIRIFPPPPDWDQEYLEILVHGEDRARSLFEYFRSRGIEAELHTYAEKVEGGKSDREEDRSQDPGFRHPA